MELVCMGVLIMDMFPSETGKKLAEVSAYKPTPGGAPANVAVAAARLGVRSAFIGKVGDDAFGRHLADVIKSEGVDIRGVRFDKEVRTTVNFHAKPEKGVIEYLFYRNPGADTTLRIDELDAELIRSSKVLHFDSLCLTDEPSRSTTLKALDIARESDTIVSFDVNYRAVLWEKPVNAVKCVFDVLGKVDILKLNEDEIRLIYPDMDIKNAVSLLLDKGPKLCLVTLGQRGSYYASRAGDSFVPTFDVDVKDTIGCGDAFIGGFLSRLVKEDVVDPDNIENNKLLEFVRYADTVAALTSTRFGALPALPRLDEVKKYYRERGN